VIQYHKTAVISGRGTGRNQWRTSLTAIVADDTGLVYAAGDREIKVFDSSTGTLRRQWPTLRPGRCVTLDSEGHVYVGEAGQIEVFDTMGKRRDLWRDPDRLGLVTALDFSDDAIFVGDAKNRCIRRFDRQRRHQNDIGHDTRTHGFIIPNGQLDFDLDSQGIVYAAHSGKHRVEHYSPDGALLGRFGRFGMRDPAHFRGCCNPTNLALTADGNIVVTEKAGPRVKVYDRKGELLSVMGEKTFDPNCRNMDIATDPLGRIYVTDTVRLQIVVYAAEAMTQVQRKEQDGTENGVQVAQDVTQDERSVSSRSGPAVAEGVARR